MRQTVLIYGVTGNGKSSFAGTGTHPIFYIDAEARAQNIHPEDLLGIDFTYVNLPGDLWNVYLTQSKLAKEGKFKYRTIVVDSLREVQRIYLDELRVQYPSDKDKFTVWDKAHGKVQQLIRAFRDFPKLYNVDLVFTCPAFDSKDGDNLEQVPLLEGQDKFIKEVMGLFDSIFYIKPMYNGTKMEYKLITRDTGKIRAKNPSRTLETVLDVTESNLQRWTLRKVLDEISNKREEAKV